MNQNRVWAVLLLFLALFGLGCLQGGPAQPSIANETAPRVLPPPATPALVVLAPEESQVFIAQSGVTDIEVSISTSDLILRPSASTNRVGEGHFLIQLDTEQTMRVYSKDYTLYNVAPGEHTLKIELVHNDDGPYSPPIKKEVRFLVLLPPVPVTEYAVEIQDFAYAPAELTIKAGDSVTWTNTGRAPRTATSTGNFNTGTLGPGQSYTYTFTEAGTYDYFALTYPTMKGKVIVEE